jgi:uncharacterized protein (TIGR03083 family)
MREEIELIASQRARLLALLGTLADGDWPATTACAPWDLRDVVAHLVDGELSLGPLYRSEVKELPYQDPELGIARWRALPGPAVAAALWQHGTATQRVLEAITEEAWRAPLQAFGCRSVGQLARLHLFELAMHGRDVAAAAGAQPHWDDCVGFLAEHVVRVAPRTLARLGVAPEGALAVRAAGKAWTIDGRAGTWALAPGASNGTDAGNDVATGNEPDATIELDAVPMIEAVTGRRDASEVFESAKVTGDVDAARRIFLGWRVLAFR